ncbi:MAG: hypothetical protein VXW67_05100 [Bacteroidota bacterium]|nr:hypothetical protein [Bacteroidota bacterium]
MLSQKLQDDLMTAYQKVYEEKRGHAAGASDAEKQASQLASDVRYKAQSKIPKGASEEEKRKIYLQILNASPAPNVVKAMAKEKLLGEKKKTVKEAKYDNRYSDNTGEESKKKKKALEKKRGMKLDKHPQFTREDKEEKAPRMQKGAMAYDGPNKERSEAADRVLAKAKKKREKMKEEYVDEKFGAAKLASARKKLARTPTQKKQFKLTKGQKEVLAGRTAAGMATRAGIIGATGMAIGGKIEADAEKKREERTAKIRRQPNFTTSDAYSSYNLKLDHTPDGELIDEMKVKQVVKPKPARNPQNMALPKGVKSGVNYQNMAQSYVPVGNIFNEKKMDPVGAEDKDIDNDGDHDKTDKYLLNRRKAIGKAIAKKRGRVKEGFSAWRIDLDFNEQVKK